MTTTASIPAPTPAPTSAPPAAAARVPFDGILFFPVTPFDAAGAVDLDVFEAHVAARLPFAPGAVFPACGTGELHALSVAEAAAVVRRAVEVVAGVGGSLGTAVELARAAEAAGADALLVLPPYLVQGTQAGLVAYVDTVLAAGSLPVVLYHRGDAQYSAQTVRRLAANPRVIGFKDGVGDLARAQEVVLAVAEAGRAEFLFFNGLLTAELSQAAYRGIGMPLYSSAAFAMAPEIAMAHYAAYRAGDEQARQRTLSVFYRPLVALRDEVPGFAVSLIKAGLRLRGLDVGSVRAPFVDPTPEQLDRLSDILDAGLALADEAGDHRAVDPARPHPAAPPVGRGRPGPVRRGRRRHRPVRRRGPRLRLDAHHRRARGSGPARPRHPRLGARPPGRPRRLADAG
ncbi:5-dehydro-4-deoxyglucarate dehydratase [Parafrankia sp. EUN1f]|nr:5-dehydro-4-deoxyglucarate dehydratase [Parafrankia sp. EUN1f]EFC86068.1 5-dehydro-4-deoxyglucarate dehydratase [Parafrankia sp. EUN1f]